MSEVTDLLFWITHQIFSLWTSAF